MVHNVASQLELSITVMINKPERRKRLFFLAEAVPYWDSSLASCQRCLLLSTLALLGSQRVGNPASWCCRFVLFWLGQARASLGGTEQPIRSLLLSAVLILLAPPAWSCWWVK